MSNYLSSLLSCLVFVAFGNIPDAHSATADPIVYLHQDTTKTITVPIDTDRSLILWKITEMWQSGKHKGTLKLSKGYLLFKDNHMIGGHIVADMNSIAITDIPKHEPVPRRRLRNHLKSKDFFYVEKYPTATFDITQTEPRKDNNIKVYGKLSIRNVSKPISFIASQETAQQTGWKFYATFKINRFSWNVSYQGTYWENISSILDNTLVDADIFLSVQLIASP
ncbi:MAG: YceI family protein [Balneolaceae bacterium]